VNIEQHAITDIQLPAKLLPVCTM